MGLEETTKLSFNELNTHVIDKSLFGVRNKMIVVVSWADLARSELHRTYKGAVDFILRYIVTGTDYVRVAEFAKILEDRAMSHPYDNAFRLEIYKPNLYPTFLQTERYAY